LLDEIQATCKLWIAKCYKTSFLTEASRKLAEKTSWFFLNFNTFRA